MRNFSIDIVWAKIQMAVAAIGGWLGYFLGGMDGLMIALIVFMALDYITGLMCATPTSIRISTFLQMPLKPTALDSFLSAMAHMRPVI